MAVTADYDCHLMPVRFRPNVASMSAYVPGEQPPAGAQLIKLNTNENPYPPSPHVAEAIANALGGTGEPGNWLRLYPDPNARLLCEAAALELGIPVSRVLAGNGSDELLASIFRAFVSEGDAIAYPYPTYVLYETLAAAQAARSHASDFSRQFELPLDELAASEAPLVCIASPNSPSGSSVPTEQLEVLAERLARDGRVLVIDEAYADFAKDNAIGLVERHDNVIVLRTLSKSYSLAGLRVGLLLAQEAIIAGLRKVKDSYSLDRLAIVAAAAALEDQTWMQRNVARIRATRSRLSEGLRGLGLEVLPSEANFVFVRMGSAERAAAAFRRLREAQILVRYFPRRLLDDGLRITVGTDDEIAAFLVAMAAFAQTA